MKHIKWTPTPNSWFHKGYYTYKSIKFMVRRKGFNPERCIFKYEMRTANENVVIVPADVDPIPRITDDYYEKRRKMQVFEEELEHTDQFRMRGGQILGSIIYIENFLISAWKFGLEHAYDSDPDEIGPKTVSHKLAGLPYAPPQIPDASIELKRVIKNDPVIEFFKSAIGQRCKSE